MRNRQQTTRHRNKASTKIQQTTAKRKLTSAAEVWPSVNEKRRHTLIIINKCYC